MKHKKILYLTPGCFDKGGISRYNRYQVQALREFCGEKYIKVLSLLGPAEGDFEDPFKVTWHAWGASKRSKLVFTVKFLQLLMTWKPDIIWLGHINLTELLVRFKLFNHVTSVLNIYGLEVWSGLRPKVEQGFKRVNHVISDCHYTSNFAEEEGFRPKDSIQVIWDCVNLDKFKPTDGDDFYKRYGLPDPDKHPWILTLGRLSFTAAHKGYERLIEVFSKIAKTDTTAVLVFAGKGDMTDHLKSLASKLGVQDRVYFSGMVYEADMAKFYTAATVFSLVSDRGKGRGEGIPLTPLEAMACGTPIIVGDQDGSQEAVFNNTNGFCIDPFDLKSHKCCILRLIKESSKGNPRGKAALDIAKRYFSFEKV
jgi:phosphatidylinositol alpha-1,6-mannosyltransferase